MPSLDDCQVVSRLRRLGIERYCLLKARLSPVELFQCPMRRAELIVHLGDGFGGDQPFEQLDGLPIFARY
jgi:hypothetical protein